MLSPPFSNLLGYSIYTSNMLSLFKKAEIKSTCYNLNFITVTIVHTIYIDSSLATKAYVSL